MITLLLCTVLALIPVAPMAITVILVDMNQRREARLNREIESRRSEWFEPDDSPIR